MSIFKNIIALLSIAIIVSTHSNDISASTCQNGTTVIYYVNGVYNTRAQAEASLVELERAYKENLKIEYEDEAQKFNFKLSYNMHEGDVEDLMEVIQQKIEEEGFTERGINRAMVYTALTTGKDLLSNFLSDEQDKREVKDVIFSAVAKQVAIKMNAERDYSAHTSEYLSQLKQGNRVLLIAHSQGNLFANNSISSLMGEYSTNIGMIGVATPADQIYNDSTYYTAHDDRVIDALRSFFDVLPSNVENDISSWEDNRDDFNHAFIDSYFNEDLPSRNKIDNDVDINMTKLQCNPDADGDGHDSIDKGGDDCVDHPDGIDGISGTADDGALINPASTDIPNDGIDQDCDGSDAKDAIINEPTDALCPQTIAHNSGYSALDDLYYDDFTINDKQGIGFAFTCHYSSSTPFSWGDFTTNTATLTLWYSMQYGSDLDGKCFVNTNEPIVEGSSGRIHSTIRALTAWPINTQYPVQWTNYDPPLYYQMLEAAVDAKVGIACDDLF